MSHKTNRLIHYRLSESGSAVHFHEVAIDISEFYFAFGESGSGLDPDIISVELGKDETDRNPCFRRIYFLEELDIESVSFLDFEIWVGDLVNIILRDGISVRQFILNLRCSEYFAAIE